ncbi:DnaB-like helicase C-terminal domain-containing protein [Candidatus Vidania fulgoroideorum]
MNDNFLYKLERYILCNFIIYKNNLNYTKLLSSKNFKYKYNKILFKVIKKLTKKKKKIDIITIYDFILKKKINFNFEYLNKLIEEKTNFINIKKYLKILKKKNLRNKLLKLLKKSSFLVKKNINLNKIIIYIKKNLSKLSNEKKNNYFDIKKDLMNLQKNILNKKIFKNYIKTGFKKIDNIIRGFSPGELIVIAGRPSSGKTAFCINLCEYICLKKKNPIFFFSLEMSKDQVILRLLSSICNINFNKLYLLKKKILKNSIKKIKKSSFFLNDNSSFNIHEFKINIKRICKKKKIRVIIIDYLQLISVEKKENRNLEISEVSRFFKILAKDLNIVIILISQLNRNLELRNSKIPILSDLKDSGSIEQDADIIIFLYNNFNEKKINILIGKNRNGNTGNIVLNFNKNITKFKND